MITSQHNQWCADVIKDAMRLAAIQRLSDRRNVKKSDIDAEQQKIMRFWLEAAYPAGTA